MFGTDVMHMLADDSTIYDLHTGNIILAVLIPVQSAAILDKRNSTGYWKRVECGDYTPQDWIRPLG